MRPHGQAVKTPPSQGGIRSSILRGATINKPTIFWWVYLCPVEKRTQFGRHMTGNPDRNRFAESSLFIWFRQVLRGGENLIIISDKMYNARCRLYRSRALTYFYKALLYVKGLSISQI